MLAENPVPWHYHQLGLLQNRRLPFLGGTAISKTKSSIFGIDSTTIEFVQSYRLQLPPIMKNAFSLASHPTAPLHNIDSLHQTKVFGDLLIKPFAYWALSNSNIRWEPRSKSLHERTSFGHKPKMQLWVTRPVLGARSHQSENQLQCWPCSPAANYVMLTQDWEPVDLHVRVYLP